LHRRAHPPRRLVPRLDEAVPQVLRCAAVR
jgi:hypothetical protein